MRIIIITILVCLSSCIMAQEKNVFLVNPYLQLGYSPTENSLQLLWQTNEADADWQVEYQNISGQLVKSGNISYKKVSVSGVTDHRIYQVSLVSLKPGELFHYVVKKNNTTVFAANAHAPKAFNQPFNFVVFGDVGAGTKEAREIAEGVYKANADMVLIPGDIVYDNGLIREYQKRFWPIYNATPKDTFGFPIMSQALFVASTGNHDADTRDLDKYPDALAYYYYWQQPLNGPGLKEGTNLVPVLKANDNNRKAFTDAAGNAYPKMTNFSYNYGNSHWLILDADNYVDVTDTTLTNWISRDLEAAKNYEWKFVMFHHPGFNSSIDHYEQQQARLLAPFFEKGKVDIVFTGHVHNYQRSYPLTFKPKGKGVQLIGGKDGKTFRGKIVNGAWTLDKSFDGQQNTKPKGVIYVITGAGGQELYNPEQQNDKDSWQNFTHKFISQVHTFTSASINGKTLTVHQFTADGKEVDRFIITH